MRTDLPAKFLLCVFGLLLLNGRIPALAEQLRDFDYYVLSLSWSPEFCHSNPANAECSGGNHFGFIVHGLWPEFQNGGGPEFCSNVPGLTDPAKMLDIMPDLHLIAHEWQAHGTCSGLAANEYFSLIRKAFSSLRIPRQFVNLTAQFSISPLDIKRSFEESNPSLTDASVAIGCKANYLSTMNICLSKDLHPIACTALRDCRARTIRVAPVR